jgi:hypothetical protein
VSYASQSFCPSKPVTADCWEGRKLFFNSTVSVIKCRSRIVIVRFGILETAFEEEQGSGYFLILLRLRGLHGKEKRPVEKAGGLYFRS